MIFDLLSLNKQGLVLLISGNGDHSNNHLSYYGQTDATAFEIEKLKLSLAHKDELLKQKDLFIEQQEKQIQLLMQLNRKG